MDNQADDESKKFVSSLDVSTALIPQMAELLGEVLRLNMRARAAGYGGIAVALEATGGVESLSLLGTLREYDEVVTQLSASNATDAPIPADVALYCGEVVHKAVTESRQWLANSTVTFTKAPAA